MTDKYHRQLKAGEILFREGEPGDFAYVVQQGLLEVFRGSGRKRAQLALLGPGEVVGEIALIDQFPRTASVAARRPTTLQVISSEHLQAKLATADPLMRVLLQMTLKRYRDFLAGGRPARRKKPAEAGRRQAMVALRLAQQLEAALEREEFTLYLQPIVRLDDMAIAGVEALVRWNHPKRGVVLPGEFIPLMEESGLIHKLGRWVMRHACMAIARLNSLPKLRGSDPLYICVNLSGRELGAPGLLGDIRGAVKAAGIPPQWLQLEITEGVMVSNFTRAIEVIERCRALGIRVAVDDFGTGYSSLNYLRQFKVDTLKIDRSFVAPMVGDVNGQHIVRAIKDLAHAMKMTVVAEGVEDLDQAELLHQLGLECAQGYLFARPGSKERMKSLLGQHWPWTFDRRNPKVAIPEEPMRVLRSA